MRYWKVACTAIKCSDQSQIFIHQCFQQKWACFPACGDNRKLCKKISQSFLHLEIYIVYLCKNLLASGKVLAWVWNPVFSLSKPLSHRDLLTSCAWEHVLRSSGKLNLEVWKDLYTFCSQSVGLWSRCHIHQSFFCIFILILKQPAMEKYDQKQKRKRLKNLVAVSPKPIRRLSHRIVQCISKHS